MSTGAIIAIVIGALIVLTILANLKDLIRYIKISNM